MALKRAQQSNQPGPALELPPLSELAARFLQEHPAEARMAVSVALETAANQFADGLGVPAHLRKFLVDVPEERDEEELLGPLEAAKRLGVSRATIYNWIDENRLLSWRVTRAGAVIPAEQIVGRGEVVPGIDRVIHEIGDARAAWRFLTEESPFFDRPRRPIDVLKEGDLKAVWEAAQSQTDSFS